MYAWHFLTQFMQKEWYLKHNIRGVTHPSFTGCRIVWHPSISTTHFVPKSSSETQGRKKRCQYEILSFVDNIYQNRTYLSFPVVKIYINGSQLCRGVVISLHPLTVERDPVRLTVHADILPFSERWAPKCTSGSTERRGRRKQNLLLSTMSIRLLPPSPKHGQHQTKDYTHLNLYLAT